MTIKLCEEICSFLFYHELYSMSFHMKKWGKMLLKMKKKSQKNINRKKPHTVFPRPLIFWLQQEIPKFNLNLMNLNLIEFDKFDAFQMNYLSKYATFLCLLTFLFL